MTQGLDPSSKTPSHLAGAADRFKPVGKVVDLREYGNGNVHDTFLVTLDAKDRGQYILQRINTQVFRQPQLVMRNMRTCTEHMRARLQRAPLSSGRRWEIPRVLVTCNGQDHWIDPDGSFWRALSFIEAAPPFDTIQDAEHAREVGFALGMFHGLIDDLPPEGLADTLEGFHITPRYLLHFDEVLEKNGARQSPETAYGLRFVNQRRAWVHVLEAAKTQGRLRLRPIHGDPKVNNVLIDAVTRQAVSMVDLDTVKPGLVQYDVGDCLRSCCNPLGEETARWEEVRFETELCRVILQGYLSVARHFLTEHDYAYLFDAVRLIAFELGLRFFTDYLEGNVYFKVKYPAQNLARALVQFRLTQSIESQEGAIGAIIQELR
jgi:Ser/Thr protein kinase RdoA (MazF antagonist)